MRTRRIRLALAAAILLVLAMPAVAFAEYGVIAVNKGTGRDGIGVAPVLSRAKQLARRACPGHCVAAAWAQTECVAVVHVRRRYFAGFGASKRTAIKNARRRAGHPRARITGAICPGPGNAPIDYGSIAVNRGNGHTGGGFGPTKGIAEKLARQNCGSGCVIALWVRNECGALIAVQPGQYAAGLGPTPPAAVQDALQRAGVQQAFVLTYVCAGSAV
jgi:hypothetical protein